MTEYHIPVMLQECLEGLNIKPDGIYVDLTFGGGGHSKAILEKLSKYGLLFAFDVDPQTKNNSIDDERFCLIEQNYCKITEYLKLYRINKVDGILADLGVSSHQIDCAERGFSTRMDGYLDLRMNNTYGLTAADVVNTYDYGQLKEIFKNYGELDNAAQIAKRIGVAQPNGICTTNELKEILIGLAPKGKENKFFAKVFQALRIEVNKELENLEKMLIQCEPIMNIEARLVVMSYHSLEDRLVKNYMKYGNCKGEIKKDFYGNISNGLRMLTKKPVTANEEELCANPRSRSAKLRIAEKNK